MTSHGANVNSEAAVFVCLIHQACKYMLKLVSYFTLAFDIQM